MNFKRLLNTQLGQVFISILLGLGLAMIFRKVCKDKNCVQFKGPILSDMEGKIYKHGEKCYRYTTEPGKCDSLKKTVDIAQPEDIEKPKSMFGQDS